MKRNLTIVVGALFILMLTGCSGHPRAGDVYENKLNSQRVKIIEVGKGSELAERFRRDKETLEKANTKDIQAQFVFNGDSISDAAIECVLYKEESKDFLWHTYVMKRNEYFVQDFHIVE